MSLLRTAVVLSLVLLVPACTCGPGPGLDGGATENDSGASAVDAGPGQVDGGGDQVDAGQSGDAGGLPDSGVVGGDDSGVGDGGAVIDLDAGVEPTVQLTAPAFVTSGKPGVTASVMATDARTYVWSIVGGTITSGTTNSSIEFTAGTPGTLVLTCTVINSLGAATAFAQVSVVAPPVTPMIRFLTGSDLVPLATRGHEGLTAFVTRVAGRSYSWSIAGGTITSPTTLGSIVYTAGNGASLTLSVTETNEAGDSSTPGIATQPLASANVSLWAGALGGPGNLDGIGPAARLSYPSDIAVGPDGTAFIVDQDNGSIRVLSPSGALTTLTSPDAGLLYPSFIARTPDGGLFITDLMFIKTVGSDGTVKTIAGSGQYGTTDGVGASASFGSLGGIAVSNGAVFVSDWTYGTLRKATVLADGGYTTSTLRTALTNPRGLAVSSSGSIYIAEASTCSIDVLTGSVLTTIGASGDAGCGAVDGPFSSASLDAPWGLRFDSSGSSLYASETYNQDVRVLQFADGGSISTLGAVARPQGFDIESSGQALVAQGGLNTVARVSASGATVLVGLPTNAGSADGDAGVARFALYGTGSVGVDPRTGTVYVTDSANQTVRAARFDSRGGPNVTTVVGKVGSSGFVDGPATTAMLSSPAGVAVDPGTSLVWVVDQGNAAVRTFSLGATQVMSTPVGGGLPCNGSLDGVGINAGLCSPTAIAIDSMRSTVYVADDATHRIYELTPSGQPDGTYRAKAIIGTGSCGSTGTSLCAPSGLAVDSSGTLYIADTGNDVIRTWANGVLTTIAGTEHQLRGPQGLALINGALYVADTGNGTIRKLTGSGSSWVSSIILGQPGRHGTVLAGAATTLNRPTSLAATPWGDLIIVDANENSVLLYRQ